MKIYQHLSQEQRYQIAALLKVGKSQALIAECIGCHKSTVSRELRRNTRRGGPLANKYDAQYAQWRVGSRQQERYPYRRFSPQIRAQILPWLTVEKLSPELITARGRERFGEFISHETIYKWIWKMKGSAHQADAPYRYLYQHLKHGRRRRKRGNHHDNRGCIPNRISIEKRPGVVEKRKRFGDFEVDLMKGKNNKSSLLVIVDRATLYTRLKKILSKKSSSVARAIVETIQPLNKLISTFTYDNDLAFAKHEQVNENLKTRSYFTHPYSSQDKGTVENRIGVLRRFLPKHTNLDEVCWQRVKQIERFLNNRPVRKFDYKTPNAVFLQKSKVALVT